MRRAGIEYEMVMMFFYMRNVVHFQTDDVMVIDFGFMCAIACGEAVRVFMNAHMKGELNEATAAVSAHATGFAICIEIGHPKIIACCCVHQQEPVGTNAKFPVAQMQNLLTAKVIIGSCSVIKNDKVVSCALVFMKMDVHMMTDLIC
jgi:hypothetical protein